MSDQILRQQQISALQNRQAHQLFDDVIKNFPPACFNTRPANLTDTFWRLLEQLRIAQRDILDCIENPDYQYLDFPQDYWPRPDAQANEDAWNRTITDFRGDLAALVEIAGDPTRDLSAQMPHGQPGHTILREVIIVVQHNSYHIGEFGILRGMMNLW